MRAAKHNELREDNGRRLPRIGSTRLSMRNKQENSNILVLGNAVNHNHFSLHSDRTAMPPLNYVNFTLTSRNVICQRCKVSFQEGVELHFLQDLTSEGPGKKVCNECHHYYVTKTKGLAQTQATCMF